jgi:hypothetical protein
MSILALLSLGGAIASGVGSAFLGAKKQKKAEEYQKKEKERLERERQKQLKEQKQAAISRALMGGGIVKGVRTPESQTPEPDFTRENILGGVFQGLGALSEGIMRRSK